MKGGPMSPMRMMGFYAARRTPQAESRARPLILVEDQLVQPLRNRVRQSIGAAVVRRLGNFAQVRHLVDPQLVHDYARFLVAPPSLVSFAFERLGRFRQRAFRHGGRTRSFLRPRR